MSASSRCLYCLKGIPEDIWVNLEMCPCGAVNFVGQGENFTQVLKNVVFTIEGYMPIAVFAWWWFFVMMFSRRIRLYDGNIHEIRYAIKPSGKLYQFVRAFVYGGFAGLVMAFLLILGSLIFFSR